jgi:hypothetical protein
MQLTKTLWVSAGSNQRFSACRDRPVARIGPKSNWARTIGIPDLLVVGNLDRRWLAALVWTLETRIEGESKMMGRFGMIVYGVGLGIAFTCGMAALTILVAMFTNKISESGDWIAAVFFAAVGGLCWLAGRAAKSILAGI